MSAQAGERPALFVVMGYSGVMIDPPWPERGGGKIKRGCDRWYEPIDKWPEIVRVLLTSGVWDNVGEDAHLYLWSTSNYESWAHRVIEALGFRHLQTLPWVKPGNAGIGQYWRGAHEPLMFAVRGRGFAVRSKLRGLRSDCLVGAPRPVGPDGKRIHSAKPIAAYEAAESRTTGALLEMFARPNKPERARWDLWGNEILKGAD